MINHAPVREGPLRVFNDDFGRSDACYEIPQPDTDTNRRSNFADVHELVKIYLDTRDIIACQGLEAIMATRKENRYTASCRTYPWERTLSLQRALSWLDW